MLGVGTKVLGAGTDGGRDAAPLVPGGAGAPRATMAEARDTGVTATGATVRMLSRRYWARRIAWAENVGSMLTVSAATWA